jgi:hypothetical protein
MIWINQGKWVCLYIGNIRMFANKCLLASIMKKYYININSHRIAIILVIILFSVFFYVLSSLPKGMNSIFSFILILGLFVGIAYLVTILSRARIKIEITDESFKHIWIRRFLFSREKDIEIKWSQIIDYVFEEDRGFDSFQLTLPDNKRYKIYRYNYLAQKDDFDKFNTQFPKNLRKINEINEDEIKEGKSFYQEAGFKWLMVFMTAGVAFIFADKLLNLESGTRWGTLGVLGTAILFYWLQIRKKNN